MGCCWLTQFCRFQLYDSMIHRIVYCIVFTTLSQVFHHHLSPLYSHLSLPPTFPLVITILLSVSIIVLLNPFTFSPSTQPPLWQPSVCFLIYQSVSILFVRLCCSLDSTYKWNHMVFVFFSLAYYIWHNRLQVHPCFSKK